MQPFHERTDRAMQQPRQFSDRTDAGERLAEALRERGVDADVVLGIPRGGLPVAGPVADALDAPLDVVVAKKIGAPGNPEYAVGAVAADGSVWRNAEAFRVTDADEAHFQARREEAAANARRKAERYRGEGPEPELEDATVVVVDDGVATGSTARACLEQVRSAEAGRVVLAVPVGPAETVRELEEVADEVVCLRTPASLGGVGGAYGDFSQVSDEAAMSYLARGRRE
jgi:putative phosphoribosyl transferase